MRFVTVGEWFLIFSHIFAITLNTTLPGTYFDGTTTFVNASTCTRAYRATNLPIVIDLPLDPSLPAQVVDFDAQTFEDPVAIKDDTTGKNVSLSDVCTKFLL